MNKYDAIVIGAGPNGLAAAITLVRAGRRVLIVEARDTIGGGTSSAEITIPGFIHDLGSAVHPLGIGSPFFRSLPLAEYGLHWAHPPIPLAHPLDDGSAVTLERSVSATAAQLGRDATAYWRLMAPLTRYWDPITTALLSPIWPPRNLFALASFGMLAIWPATMFASRLFRGVRARALFAGLAAHAAQPLEAPATAAFGLLLGLLGHALGWPSPKGGAQQIANSMAGYLRANGAEIMTGMEVHSLEQLPPASAILFDTTPRQAVQIAGSRMPAGYRRALERFRYGFGAFKVDWALDGPIPWRAPECRRAGTVHLGGTLEEIAASESAVGYGLHPERPYILLAQPSVFDPTRAPAGKQSIWAYCHVPNGSTLDMAARIEAQIERFAPGFRNRILARHIMAPADLERFDANLVGGDVGGGAQDLGQLFTRPTISLNPYRMPVQGLYFCSASTPPGGGVHGMCGYHAAQAVLRDLA